MRGLNDSVFVVTGSAGIAASTVRRLHAEGARVGIIGIDADEVEALVAETSSERVSGHVADLTDGAGAAHAFAEVERRHGAIDGVAAVVGGSGRRFGDGPIDELTDEAWRATVELNTHPVMVSVREGVQRGAKSIVVVSSVLATNPGYPHFTTHAYAAAKGAGIALVRSVAAMQAQRGVRINCVLPSATRTPGAARAAANEELMDHLRRKQPLAGGLLDPDDVAASIAFLLSDDAAMITGQAVVIDGGWTVTDAGP